MKAVYIAISAITVGFIAYLIAREVAKRNKPAAAPAPTPAAAPPVAVTPTTTTATPVVPPAPAPAPAPTPAPVPLPVPVPPPPPTTTPAPTVVITPVTPPATIGLYRGADGNTYMSGLPAPYNTWVVKDWTSMSVPPDPTKTYWYVMRNTSVPSGTLMAIPFTGSDAYYLSTYGTGAVNAWIINPSGKLIKGSF